MNQITSTITNAGTSLWLDDLSRERLTSGSLAALIESHSIQGVTTNPSIFQAAITGASDYDEALKALAKEGREAESSITALTTSDVRDACDVFAQVFARSNGVDGRVSIEVDPRLAHDAAGTIRQARELYDLVGRDNVMIKIPATDEGIEAITAVIAEGISVNVTLIFSIERYLQVIDAYMSGLEKASAAGKDLSSIHSVASFFVSRVDSEIDPRLEALGGEALALRGKAGLANAQAAYGAFLESLDTERWRALADQGAHVQRPLWASTGVKNPDYPDTMYVDQLVAPSSVNTVPEKTLVAVADHARLDGQITAELIADARDVLEKVEAVGVDLDDVFATLEKEGVDKFIAAWEDLLEAVQKYLDSHR